MSKVWRRLQRVGKKAAKYKLTTLSHVLTLNCSSKWQPDKICLTWAHRNRKYQSKFAKWEPGLTSVYEGVVEWEKSSDQIEFDVTLYRGMNEDKYEEKEWILMVESEDKGKRKLLATGKINIDQYVSIEPFYQQDVIDFKLKPASSKIKSSSISFSIACQFIKDGKATDEDMISIASFMSSASTNNPYLNSNCLYDQNYGNTDDPEDYDSDTLDYHNENSKTNKHRAKIKARYLQVPSKINRNTKHFSENDHSEFDEDLNETENENNSNEDDIDYYFKLQSKQINSNFNNIAFNFNNNNNSNNNDNSTLINKKPQIEDTKRQTKPIIKSTNSASINSSSQIKLPSLNKLPSLAPIKTSSSFSKPKELPTVEYPNINPFLEKEDNSNNPFSDKEMDESNESKKNPFLDENSNPFLSEEKTLNKDFSILNSSNTSKDLLDWCKDVIKKTKSSSPCFNDLTLNDFSTSWTSGLAFCAIIYHFKPDLIDLKLLNETDAKANLKQAFEASDKESIVRVVDYIDILNKKNLDQLSIMTYLYQIRDRYDSQTVAQSPIKSVVPTSTSFNKQLNTEPIKTEKSKSAISLTAQKSIENKTIPKSEYFNPFDSDDDGEEMKKLTVKKRESSGIIEIKPNGQIIDADSSEKNVSNETKIKNKLTENGKKSSNNVFSNSIKEVNSSEDLIQKAKILMEKNKQSPSHPDHSFDSSKKEDVKQRAKQIIAENKKQTRRRSSGSSLIRQKSTGSTVIKNADQFDELIGTEYINQEILNLKSKQNELDERGNYIEKELRQSMKKMNSSVDPKGSKEIGKKLDKEKEAEDKLLREWFLLINEKNKLLHRQQELEILQNEKNLEKRYEILSNQLRNLMQIEDFLKTEEQKKTESILFNELIILVNKRNELVIQLDEENKMLNEGEVINEFIQNKSSFQPKEKQCVIQ